MEKPHKLFVRVTHDCGQQAEIDVDDLEKKRRCVACGRIERLSQANLDLIMSRLGHTLMEVKRRAELDGERGRAEYDFHKGSFV